MHTTDITMESLFVFPPYLRFFSIEKKHQSDDPYVDAKIGLSFSNSKQYRLHPLSLLLLRAADGNSSLRDILDNIQDLSPETVDVNLIFPIVEMLMRQSLLVPLEKIGSYVVDREKLSSRHDNFFAMVGGQPDNINRTLAQKKVGVIGCGGIGNWVTFHLALSGVGELILVDPDVVETSNLPRQILFDSDDIGQSKAISLRKKILQRNSKTRVNTIEKKITKLQDLQGLENVDLLILSGDSGNHLNFLINEFAMTHSIPWIRAGYMGGVGVCGPLIVPHQTSCQNCISGSIQHDTSQEKLVAELNANVMVPSFGPLNGIIASIASREIIFYLGGLVNQVQTLSNAYLFDIETLQSRLVAIDQKKRCSTCQGEAHENR